MIKTVKNTILLPVLGCLAAMVLTGCSDWTDSESLGIQGPTFPHDNPELHARYLAELRSYKSSDHSVTFGWFDNREKQPSSRAQHIASVPDSMDVVSLLHPDNLAEWELSEMQELRQKGTQVVYTFSYAAILAAYEATLPPPVPADETVDEEPVVDGFLAFLASQTDYYLRLSDKYGYDGVSVFYEPIPLLHLAPEDKIREQARQVLFTAKLAAWTAAHPSQIFIFEGRPQDLVDKSLLGGCRYIVLRCFSVTSAPRLSESVRQLLREGVPADRFVVGVMSLPIDASDLVTGRFSDVSGALTLPAVTEAAKWVATPEVGFTKAGLGIYNLQNDYYSTSVIYSYTRTAISTLNPHPKK